MDAWCCRDKCHNYEIVLRFFVVCWTAKDFDEDDDDEDDDEEATRERSKKQKTAETEESFDKQSKMSSADHTSKGKEKDDDIKAVDTQVHFRVTIEDAASAKAKSDLDDGVSVDQQVPAAKQQPEGSAPHSTQPLASKLKDQLEQAGLKTEGSIDVAFITAATEVFSYIDTSIDKFSYE